MLDSDAYTQERLLKLASVFQATYVGKVIQPCNCNQYDNPLVTLIAIGIKCHEN